GSACFHYARSLADAGKRVLVLLSVALPGRERARWARHYKNKYKIDFICMNQVGAHPYPLLGVQGFSELSLRLFRFLRRLNTPAIFFQDWYAQGFWSVRAK